jgi:predicted Ser/Thr protein kinase
MAEYSPEVAAAVDELGGVHLPANIELLEVAGRGSRSIVFKARFRDEIVALKVYRPDVAQTYREKHDLNIAVFEMSRNRKFRKVAELFPFSAKPIMVLGHDGKQTLSFMQEFIEGVTLEELGKSQQGLPASVLNVAHAIARYADEAGLEDLDLDYRQVMARRQKDGQWLPVVYDFNRVPTKLEGRKALLGLFRKAQATSNVDCTEAWATFSKSCEG